MENSNQGQHPTRVYTQDVITMLENGKTRNEIGEHYNLQDWEVKELFKHEDLKGKKTKRVRVLSFVIHSGTSNNVEANEETQNVGETSF